MKKNNCKKPFWDLGLNPIDMLRPPEVVNTKIRKEYYQKTKDTFKIKNLTKQINRHEV